MIVLKNSAQAQFKTLWLFDPSTSRDKMAGQQTLSILKIKTRISVAVYYSSKSEKSNE